MPVVDWGETIDVVRNRDWGIDFEVVDADGNPYNLTGSTGHRLVVKLAKQDADASALINQTTGFTITDAVNGKITCLLAAAATNSDVKFPDGVDRPCELYFLDSGSKKVTAFLGAFRVWDNVFAEA